MKVIHIDRPIRIVTTDESHNKKPIRTVAFFDRGSAQVGDEPHQRHYLLTAPPVRLLMVLRNGVKPEDIKPGAYVEGLVGTNAGEGRPAIYRYKTHRQITVFKVLPGPPTEGEVDSFGEIVDNAPPVKMHRGGRTPLTPGENVIRSNVSLPAAMWEMFTELGDGNRSAGIRKMAERAEQPPLSHAVASQIVDQVAQALRVTPTKNQHLRATKALQEAINAHHPSQRRA